MDISLGNSEEDSEDKERIIKSIMYGDLIFNDDDEAEYTPWRKASKYRETIVFRERTGADLMAADSRNGKARGVVRQTYAMMGSLCGIEPSCFSKLSGSDIKTCEAIFTLLMG